MIESINDCEPILRIINDCYNLSGKSMRLHRTSGAKVYFIEYGSTKAVFKLYRNIHNRDALQTVDIVDYLSRNNYPVASIIPTANNKLHRPSLKSRKNGKEIIEHTKAQKGAKGFD